MTILDESLIYVLSDISTKLETIGDNLERIVDALEAGVELRDSHSI